MSFQRLLPSTHSPNTRRNLRAATTFCLPPPACLNGNDPNMSSQCLLRSTRSPNTRRNLRTAPTFRLPPSACLDLLKDPNMSPQRLPSSTPPTGVLISLIKILSTTMATTEIRNNQLVDSGKLKLGHGEKSLPRRGGNEVIIDKNQIAEQFRQIGDPGMVLTDK